MFESQLLTAMLEERPEFSDVDEGAEELILRLKPEYLPAEEKQRTRISQERRISCAPGIPSGCTMRGGGTGGFFRL